MANSTPPDPAASLFCSPAWLHDLQASAAAAELGPLQLAWLGDAVWELHQRLRQCHQPARVATMHRAVVAAVQAEAQVQVLQQLEPLLSEAELDWVRRGRNRAPRGPRRADAATYGQATGFETMLGWLFLQDPRRLAELLDHLEKTEPCPPSASP